MVIYHGVLPRSYLLVLAPGGTDASLARALHCASQSGQTAVWVDCGLLSSLSGAAARLLWAAHHQLQEKGGQLVLVHVADPVKRTVLDCELGSPPNMLPTLLDICC